MALGAGLVGLALAVFTGARLAALTSGGRVGGGLGDWLGVATRLARNPGDPGAAWGPLASGLPGSVPYWLCTAVTIASLGALGWALFRVWRRWTGPSRELFGVQADALIARPGDVRPLVVPSTLPPTGRMLLGRMAPRGPLLATEDRERHPMSGRRARRQGDRGSVALIGPTRSGKTVLASAGIVAWDGPVVALSVKRDLFDATAGARAGRGELAVFDPGGVTKLPTARWTPLRDVTTASGALRAGRALAQAIPRGGVTGGDFWAQHGETFIGAYLSLAGLSRLLPKPDGTPREPLTIELLASWAYMQVGITEPVVNELIRTGLRSDQPQEVQLLARNAMAKLMAFHNEDPRIRGSIYATARLAFESWTEPPVAHSAGDNPRHAYDSQAAWPHRPRCLDLDWLMSGGPDRANTLYLAAPDTEFARLAPVLGGLLGDLREQIHAWDIEGRPLPKPLLFVIDEAGQLELAWLPGEVATIAGLGALFVTCWQSKAQITHRYGTLADAVLGGHRSKVIFNGTDDPATLDYLSRIAGTEHVAQRGWSADVSGGRKTVSEHSQREDLLPAHVIRQMHRHEAVLIHGTLPPVHLKAVLWWEDPDLRRLVPTDANGRPVPRPTHPPARYPTSPPTNRAPPSTRRASPRAPPISPAPGQRPRIRYSVRLRPRLAMMGCLASSPGRRPTDTTETDRLASAPPASSSWMSALAGPSVPESETSFSATSTPRSEPPPAKRQVSRLAGGTTHLVTHNANSGTPGLGPPDPATPHEGAAQSQAASARRTWPKSRHRR